MKKIKVLFLFGILLAFTGFTSADVNDSWCSGWGMMSGNYGWGIGGLFGWLFGILVLIAIVLLIVWLIKQIQKK